MTHIIEVHGREIIDSRGNPTVEVEVNSVEERLAGQPCLRVPVQVNMKQLRCVMETPIDILEKGVSQAVENVNVKIAEAIVGLDATDQAGVDQAMLNLDGTPNKSFRSKRNIGCIHGNCSRSGIRLRTSSVQIFRRAKF